MKRSQNYIADIPKRRRRKRLVLWIFSVVVILCSCYAGMTWLVFQSPLFRINEIRFEGATTVSEIDIRGLIDRAIFHQKGWRGTFPIITRIFSWPDRLTDDDLAFLPRLKEVVIQKNYAARRIVVQVTEREPVGIWCFFQPRTDTDKTPTDAADSNANTHLPRDSAPGPQLSASCGWFDGEGVLFERAPRGEGSLIQSVDDYSRSEFRLRSTVLPLQFMPNFMSILSAIRSSGVSTKEMRIEDLNLEEMKITTHDGPDILFSLRFPADDAIPVLQSLFAASTSSVPFKNLNYVDFRVEHRAYYK